MGIILQSVVISIPVFFYDGSAETSEYIAKSIIKELQDRPQSGNPYFSEISEERGYGIKASDTKGNHYLLGSAKMASAFTDDLNHSVYLVINEKVVVTIDLEDALKSDTQRTINFLKDQEIKTILLSGDQKAKVAAVYSLLAYVMQIAFIVILPRINDSLHPGNGGNPAFSQYDLDSNMRLVFYPAVIGWFLLSLWITHLWRRYTYLKAQHEEEVFEVFWRLLPPWQQHAFWQK